MTALIGSLMIVLAPVAVFAADPGIASLHPLYTPETTVRNPALVGLWSDFRIESDGRTGYTIMIDFLGHTELDLHLVKLGGETIADVVFVRAPEKEVQIPSHTFVRLRLEGNTLRVAWLGSQELAQRVVRAGSPRFERLKDDDGGDDNVLLTASSAELQRFVMDCLKQTDAFTDEYTFTRATEKGADSSSLPLSRSVPPRKRRGPRSAAGFGAGVRPEADEGVGHGPRNPPCSPQSSLISILQ